MANYCDIEEVKMTSNPVYEVADMKPQSITTPKNDKSILNFLWWQRKKILHLLFPAFAKSISSCTSSDCVLLKTTSIFLLC